MVVMSALIELENVCVSRAGARVLDHACLKLEAGERLAVVGANGAGKTTLLRTIIGLQKPSAGRIFAFDRERRVEADFKEVRIRAAYLFQDADDQLFCPSVVEDVAFGPLNMGFEEDAALAKAHETLAFVGIENLASRITRRLSGGEKRLVCLAGILAMDPDVLLLDEPTNSLDATHVRKLVDVLMACNKAMVLVTHDRPVLDTIATRAVMLKDGRLEPALLHRHAYLHEHVHVHGETEDH
jgi:cobalt/nickel transport system ATP-binding protein